MKKIAGRIYRACVHPLLMAFGSLPVVLVALSNFAPVLLPQYWVFPAVYAGLLTLCICIPGRWRLTAGLVCTALILGLSVVWWQLVGMSIPFEISVFYGVMLLAGLRNNHDDRANEVSSLVFFAIHLIAQGMLLTQKEGVETLTWAQPRLVWGFLIYLILLMLSMNRDNLQDAAQGRHKISAAMRRQHKLLILILFAAALLITMIPGLIALVERFWAWLTELLKNLFRSLRVKDGEEYPSDQMGFPQFGSMGCDTKLVRNWEDVVLVLIRYGLILAGVILVLRSAKNIWVLLKKLWGLLNRYAGEVAEDYVDEVTATRELGVQELLRGLQDRNRFSAAQERALPPAERIRYRYLRLRMKHPEWESGSTAREKLPDSAAGIYEQARYSQHPVTEADANRFAEAVRNIPAGKESKTV